MAHLHQRRRIRIPIYADFPLVWIQTQMSGIGIEICPRNGDPFLKWVPLPFGKLSIQGSESESEPVGKVLHSTMYPLSLESESESESESIEGNKP